MSKDKFKEFLNNIFLKAFKVQELRDSLDKISLVFNDFFPEAKIYFAKKLGKRVSYITGAGPENCLKSRKFKLKDNYLLYLENIELGEEEKGAFLDFLKLIIYLKENGNES